jgi:hypothetical protein
MEVVRSAFQSLGNVGPVTDEIMDNYFTVVNVKTIRPWFLNSPMDFELELPFKLFEIDFTLESTEAIVRSLSKTPNGTYFSIATGVYLDPNIVGVNIIRVIEFGELCLAAFLRLGWTIEDCTLEIVILERDLEREEELYLPLSIYSEEDSYKKKPVLRRLASLFKHVKL